MIPIFGARLCEPQQLRSAAVLGRSNVQTAKRFHIIANAF